MIRPMKLSAGLAVLLVAAVALLAWTSFADAPWEDSEEPQQLTGTEAAALLESRENAKRNNTQVGDCVASDYNETTHDWIVRCTDFRQSFGEWEPVGTLTYRLADSTGDYEKVK